MTPRPSIDPLQVGDEVAAALADGRAVVALESTLLAHGLPPGDNRRVADELEQLVRDAGAVPATVAVLDGAIRVGLSAAQLDRVCGTPPLVKLSVRDVGPALALRVDGATTVASTAALAARAGIAVFATGGLGGVHRGAAETFDVSADLGVLARTPIVVVCAGVKSILDVPATLEYLETLSVPVVGYRTDRFPGFYLSDTGLPLAWRADDPEQVAAIVRARRATGLDDAAVVLANPLPVDRQLDPGLHDRTLADGLALLERDGVTGKDVTPRLLEFFHAATQGESLRVNIDLVASNVRVASAVAVALAAGR